jgi:hypothetical protein
VFVGFSSIFLLGILIFKGLTTRRLCKSFSFKDLREKNSSRAAVKINPKKFKSQIKYNIVFLHDQTTYISNKKITKIKILLGMVNKTEKILLPVFLHCSGLRVNKDLYH